jgi:ribosomal protein L23
MALFTSKKNKDTAKVAVKVATKKETAVAVVEKKAHLFHHHDVTSVILRPRVTEKGAILAESNTYLFDVTLRAHKNSVAEAVKLLYKVSPVKVSIVRVPVKSVWSKGKWGKTAGAKKAYVQLKKGDKIDLA